MGFDSIQPLALRIRSHAEPLIRNCITVPFPEHWATSLKKLQATVYNRPVEKTSVPIDSLNRTLRAVVPPIISIGRGVTNRWALSQALPWLYTYKYIEPAVLVHVVHAWAKVLFKDAPQELHQVLTTIQTHDVQWKQEQLNLMDWRQNTAGTATPSHAGQFILFPDYVAATLSSISGGFQYGDHQLHFRRSSLPPGQKGAELTSWPPLSNGKAQYSVVLTFTLQTVPFQSHPVLHCDVSLRRWAGPRKVVLKQRASTYIATNLPFVPELDGWHNQLQVASLKSELDEGGNWKTQWGDHLIEILTELRSKVSLIDADKLANEPNIGQQAPDQAAMIVHSTRMKWHEIGAGVAIRERGQLFDQIAELLSDVFEPVTPFKRVKAPRKTKITNPFFQKITSDTKQNLTDDQRLQIHDANKLIWAKRRSLIREAIGDQLNLEIRTSTTDVRHILMNAVRDVLGITLTGDANQEIKTAELTICTSIDHLSGLTDNLNLASGNGVREKVRNAIQRRINDIVRQLPKAQLPTLMLAEILPKGQYEKKSDPKLALRIGIGRTQRLVQFITTPTAETDLEEGETDEEEAVEPLHYRTVNAILDGLRQLGIPGSLPAPRPGRSCTIIGIWLINKKSSRSGSERYTLPVLVRVSSADNTILALAPGFTDWLPYREALLKLSTLDVFDQQNNRANYPAFVRTEVSKVVSDKHDTVLLCHAQNLRETWTWISNTNIMRDAIAFSNGETPIPISEWPGLRIVRVRDAQSHETPEWFAEQGGKRSASEGLFQMNERVYASTRDKPKQMQNYMHAMSKAEPWISPRRPDLIRDPSLKAPTWNPGLYELTVAALQPEDHGDPTPWAYLTHELRKSSLHFEDATALPLPLHLAKLMEEYVLSVEIQDDDEEG